MADRAGLLAVAERLVVSGNTGADETPLRDARLLNAAQPFAPIDNPPASPFAATAAGEDRERAVDCLAAAAFYEAGDDAAGQRSVAQVVLNRVRHPAFRSSVCGVVFQGSERSTGCQFTFTCDGAMRRTPSTVAWQRARFVALLALSGAVDTSVGTATHYHTDWVHPRWSPMLDKVGQVGAHLFFRWPGRLGKLGAFSVRHAGVEPRIAKLALLSPAHRAPVSPTSPANLPVPAMPVALAAPTASVTAAAERLPRLSASPDQDTFLVVLSGGQPRDHVALAERTCGRRPYCKLVAWTDPRRAAATMPIPGSSIDAISFLYVRHANDPTGRTRWNCAEFPQPGRESCLSGG